jgi:hypothetical protein
MASERPKNDASQAVPLRCRIPTAAPILSLDNLKAAVALYLAWFNFCGVHMPLRLRLRWSWPLVVS